MSRWYKGWEMFILVWAIYSSLFTPMEFGFFRGLPKRLFILDIVGQIAFLVDIVLLFFVAYRDTQTYRTVYKPTRIALRLVVYILDAYKHLTISTYIYSWLLMEEICLSTSCFWSDTWSRIFSWISSVASLGILSIRYLHLLSSVA